MTTRLTHGKTTDTHRDKNNSIALFDVYIELRYILITEVFYL